MLRPNRNLADTKSRGALDATDFIIAMYIISAIKSGSISFVPTSLPPGLYEQASGDATTIPPVAAHATGGSGSYSPGVTGAFPGRPIATQYTGQSLHAQHTGSGIRPNQPPAPPPRSIGSPFSVPNAAAPQAHWDVTTTEKANSDKFFDTLDTQRRGYVDGDVAVPFLLQSKLPGDTLAQVW
jgi:epidermal growth factor receptor substrate 15